MCKKENESLEKEKQRNPVFSDNPGELVFDAAVARALGFNLTENGNVTE